MAITDKIPLNLPLLDDAKRQIQGSMQAIYRNAVAVRDKLVAGTLTLEEYTRFKDLVIPGSLANIAKHRYRPGLIQSIDDEYHATFPDRLDWSVADAMTNYETALTAIVSWLDANDPAVTVTAPTITDANAPGLSAAITAFIDTVDNTEHEFAAE